MRRFRFQLAGLERLLVHREDSATLRAVRAAAERRRAESRLGHLASRLGAARRERRDGRRAGELSPRDELLYETYLERLGRAIDAQRQAAAQAAERHDECLDAARGAATKRRAIGLLHHRRRAEHRREALRELTRFLDEVGSRQAAGPA